MANLDLIPKLPVLAVQAGIFIANLGIMKKLFMEPYLKVRTSQNGQTIGSQGDAMRLMSEADQISVEIDGRILSAMTQAKEAREKVRGEAMAKRHSVLAEAQEQLKGHIELVEGEIKEQMQAERAKIPSVVSNLAKEVFTFALN